ncbi:BNC1 [Cordylochernes scorpioides]|uniref:BNC1 n=1 Tax=Cordylochernes scorpioides TaxID=51811 RepID=A0ABY6JY70_9ARAC|nr:BNC1 [Cordylochernes scorpioides]
MVQPNSAFDVASLVLYGAQAIPVRLKILLDRLFAALTPGDVEKVLGSFGWTDKDYARGYIAQDKEGNILDKWSLSSRDEEFLILQQFLKFGETRAVAQQLLNQTCVDKKDETFLPGSFSESMDLKMQIDRKGRPPDLVLAPRLLPPRTGSVSSLSPMESPTSVSPLNKLQNMQPYDYRRERVFVDERSTDARSPQHRVSPVMPILAPGDYSDDSDQGDEISDAINLSRTSVLDSVYASRKVRHLRKSANPMKRRFNTFSLSGMATNPATGKRRVQCTVCLKTFCDKGALKIHFSAVHLREMHQCTVEGCNMMFSSRRSRNRHSANPNPKLHTPNLRRKINPHDGRSALYYSYSNSAISCYPNTSPSKLLEQDRWAAELDQSSNQVLNLTAESNRSHKTNSNYSNSTCEEEALSLTKENHSSPPKEAPAATNHDHKNDGAGGVRKRKSMKPTKCEMASDDDIQYVSSDDSSSDTFIDQMDDDGLDSKSDDGTSEDNNSSRDGDIYHSKTSPKRPKLDIKEEPELHCNNSYPNQYSENSKEPANLEKVEHKEEPPENPLRHLESLSLGPFNSIAPPVSKPQQTNSGVIFHAPGLGLGSSPDTSRESSHTEPLASSQHYPPTSIEQDHLTTKLMTFQGDYRNISNEIPIDKENPRRCPTCHKIFQNHFGVKTHYQNVHLKVIHLGINSPYQI